MANPILRGRRVGIRGVRHVRTFEGHTDTVTSVCFSPDGRQALSGCGDGVVRLWDVNSGKCVRNLEDLKDEITCLSFSPDGRKVLVGGQETGFIIHDLYTRQSTGPFSDDYDRYDQPLHSAEFSPDGRWILSGRGSLLPKHGACLSLCESDTGQWAIEYFCNWGFRFLRNVAQVYAATFGPAGDWIVSGNWDKTVRLWDAAGGLCVGVFRGHKDDVFSVCSSPDGMYVLSAGYDKTVRLWDVVTGQCLQIYRGHRKAVILVSFTPDGRWALSASQNETLRLWDVNSGECVQVLEHGNGVTAACLSPDGRFVLSGSADKTMRLWEIDWQVEIPEPADWDDGALPYLEIFLTLHCPYDDDGISRTGKPNWNDDDFQHLLTELQYRGFGWLRPEGVRRKLEKMTHEWTGPPPLPREF